MEVLALASPSRLHDVSFCATYVVAPKTHPLTIWISAPACCIGQAPVLRRGLSVASVDPSGVEATTLAAVGDAFATGSRSDVSNWSGGVRAGSGSLVTEDSIHVRCPQGTGRAEYHRPRLPCADRI